MIAAYPRMFLSKNCVKYTKTRIGITCQSCNDHDQLEIHRLGQPARKCIRKPYNLAFQPCIVLLVKMMSICAGDLERIVTI